MAKPGTSRALRNRRVRARTALVATTLLAAGLVGMGLTLAWPYLLPAKYYADSALLKRLIASATGESGHRLFASFGNTAFAYHLLGFSGRTPSRVIGPLVFALAYVPAAAAIATGSRRGPRAGWLVIALWIAALSIYLGQYSKELFAIWASAAALGLSGARRGWGLMAFIPVILYGLFVRRYWLLIAAFWALFRYLHTRRWNLAVKGIVVLGAMVTMSVGYHLVLGHFVTSLRTTLNHVRSDGVTAQTAIHNLLPASSVPADLANWLVAVMSIAVPVPALIPPEIQVIPFVALSALTFWLLLRRVRCPPGRRRNRRRLAAITFVMAAVVVMALFEPDYGSVFKHELGFLPMIGFLLALGGGRAPKGRAHG